MGNGHWAGDFCICSNLANNSRSCSSFSFCLQLDNKSSPLALLAQTCSAIGADTTNPKLLAANIEKSTKQLPKGGTAGGGLGGGGLGSLDSSSSNSARDKSSPVSSHSSSVSTGSVEQQQLPMAHSKTPSTFKPYEANNNDCGATNLSSNNNNMGNQRVKTPKANVAPANGQQQQQQLQLQQRCDSNQSASSSQRESPSNAHPNASASASVSASAALRRTPTALGPQLNGSPVQSSAPIRSNSKESAALHSPSAASSSSSRLQEAAYAAAKEANYVKALHAASQQANPAAASYYPPGKCRGVSTMNCNLTREILKET